MPTKTIKLLLSQQRHDQKNRERGENDGEDILDKLKNQIDSQDSFTIPMNLKRKFTPRNSLSTLVIMMMMMMMMFLSGGVLCNETLRPGSIININLQHQPNNDLLDTSYGCPTVVAKITIDESIQTFVSFSRNNAIFRNFLLCIDKSCLDTTNASICPLKVEINEHSIKESNFSYLESQLIRVEIQENLTSELNIKDGRIIIRISMFQNQDRNIYQEQKGTEHKQLDGKLVRKLDSSQEQTTYYGFTSHHRIAVGTIIGECGPDQWGFTYHEDTGGCGHPATDISFIKIYAAPYFSPGPPGMIDVILGFSGSLSLTGLYNPNNILTSWSVSDPHNRVSGQSGYIVVFTALSNDWALLGPRTFTSTIFSTSGVRSQPWTSFNVINTAPRFSPVVPGNQQLFVNDTLVFTLPAYSDESGHSFTFDYNPKIPSWISIDAPNKVFTFKPTTFSDVGVKTITITLDDSNLASNTAFTVTVINRPPIYDTAVVTYAAVSVHLNYKEDVVIPTFHDPDGSDAYAKIYDPTAIPVLWSVLPDFRKLTFEPIGFNEVGVHNAFVRLYDAGGAMTDTSIQVTVLNDAPIFPWNPLPVQTIPMNISTDSTWTHWLYDYEGHVIDLTPLQLDLSNNLVAPPYFVSQAIPQSHTITVKAVKFTDIGLHKIQLKINDGGVGFNYQELFINITNWAPYFIENWKPLNHSLKMNNSFNYHLPKYADRENNPVFVSFECLPSVSSWAWIIPGDDIILFNPEKWSHMGHYECLLSLSDTKNASHYPFYIDVVNFSPKFANGIRPSNIKVRLNQELEVEMPMIIDTENNPIQVIQNLPPFIKYKDGKYQVSPFDPVFHLGYFIVRGEITDNQLSTPFKFFVQVTNGPPDFLVAPQDQVAYIGMKTEYKLPAIFDLEGLKYTVKATKGNGDKLPYFISLDKEVLKFDIPDDEALVSTEYVIKLTLDDEFSRANVRSFLLKLKKEDSFQVGGNMIIASLRVVSMSRDQLLTLRIVGVKRPEQLLDKITHRSLKIRIKETNEEIPYNITVRSNSASSITLRLGFKNHKSVSSTATLDTLEIKLRQTLSVLQLKTRKLMILPSIPITLQIPPQIGQVEASVASSVTMGIMVASIVFLTLGLLINIVLSMFIQYLWGLLNDMSFLTICSLISISVPGIGKILLTALLNFIYLDILHSELWLCPLFFPPEAQGEDGELDDMEEPLNMFFDENGFQSKALIKNLGSTFVYLIFYILLLLLLPLIRLMGRRYALMSTISNWLSKQLLWNAVFRFILQQGQPMMNAAAINALGMKFNSKVGPTLSSLMSILVAVGLLIAFGLFVKILKQQRNQDALGRSEYKEKYGTLTEGLSTKTAIGTYWNVLIQMRWIYTTAVLIFLRDHCEFQILCLIVSSVIFQCLILHGQPMPSPIENNVSVFNEVMVSLYLYTLLHLTDFFGNNIYRQEGGYVLVGIIFVSVSVNLIKFFALIIREIKIQIRLRRKTKIDQNTKNNDLLDPNQAQTLHSNPGIFAYNDDIIQRKNQQEDNNSLRNKASKLEVIGPIKKYRQFKTPKNQLSQTLAKGRLLNNNSILESFSSAINMQPPSLFPQGSSIYNRADEDKSVEDMIQDNLAYNAKLRDITTQNYTQKDRLGQQQNQISQRQNYRIQEQRHQPRPLQLNNEEQYSQMLSSIQKMQHQRRQQMSDKNHQQVNRNSIWK